MKIKFYDNKESHGIVIDWNEVRKLYKKLNTPKEFYNPCTLPLENCPYSDILSERSIGKTTNLLLFGMCANKLYGTVIQYIRQTEEMTAPSVSRELFETILSYENGRYIKELTDGKYNSIIVRWRRAYYCLRDEDGKVVEQAEEHFLMMLSIDRNLSYKSSYNAPKGDFILYDEFIGKATSEVEFVNFMDLLKTIIRLRKTPRVILSANTVNLNHAYFREQEISKEVRKLKMGDSAIFTTERGTKIYVEIYGAKVTQIKLDINKMFFGFKNPRLSAITGTDAVWAFDCYPHIVANDTDKFISKRLRLKCGDLLLQADILETEERGIIANVHPCTTTYSDSIILTNGEVWARNEYYGVGKGMLCELFWRLYRANKVYFDTNETGALLAEYVRNIKRKI